MTFSFLGDEDNLADLVARISGSDRETFNSFGHLRVEPAFHNRLFLLYRPAGINKQNRHNKPDVLTTVKVHELVGSSRDGMLMKVEDLRTGEFQQLGYIPKRLFDYDVFMSVPSSLRLRWDARQTAQGVARSMAFAVLIKTKNRSDFYSYGNLYCETPNRLRALYPGFDLDLNFL